MSEAEKRGPPELRQLLVDAAMQVLADPDTPLELRKVAELAGKSRTAPYLVFGKESEGGGLLGLRIAVAAEGAGRLAARMRRAADATSDPLLAFRSVAMTFLSFATENPRLFRLMFGSDLGLKLLSAEALRSHPEFRRLVRRRRRAEEVLRETIVRCQRRRLVPEVEEAGTLRYVMVAWSSMVGVGFLLLDEVLHAAGIRHPLEDAANLVTESVLGVDPEPLQDAVWTFLQAQSQAGTDPSPHAVTEAAAPYGAAESRPSRMRVARYAAAKEPLPPGQEDVTGALSSYRGLWRAAQSRDALRGATVLWIDDQPESVRFEAETLQRLHAHVSFARDTAEALDRLRRGSFDLIVSDIARGGDATAGVSALPELRRLAPDTPVVFYVLNLNRARGTPSGAFGIADDVDELFHLIVDGLGRRRR